MQSAETLQPCPRNISLMVCTQVNSSHDRQNNSPLIPRQSYHHPATDRAAKKFSWPPATRTALALIPPVLLLACCIAVQGYLGPGRVRAQERMDPRGKNVCLAAALLVGFLLSRLLLLAGDVSAHHRLHSSGLGKQLSQVTLVNLHTTHHDNTKVSSYTGVTACHVPDCCLSGFR